MAFRWRADGGQTLNAGLVALWYYRGSGPVLVRNPIFLLFFRGGGGSGPPVPPLDPHMSINNLLEIQSMPLSDLYWATVSLKITDTYSRYAGECTVSLSFSSC